MICRQCQFEFADDMSACPVCHTGAAKDNPWLDAFPSPEGPALPSNPWAGYEPPMPESIFRTQPSEPAPSAALSAASASVAALAAGDPTRSISLASPVRPVRPSVDPVRPPLVAAESSQPRIMAINESSILVSGVIDDERGETSGQIARREHDSAKIVLYIALGMFLAMAIALVIILV